MQGADQNGTGIWDFWYYMPYAEVPGVIAIALKSNHSRCISMQEYQPASHSIYDSPYIAWSSHLGVFVGMLMVVMLLLMDEALLHYP